jgi:hypothetical protein
MGPRVRGDDDSEKFESLNHAHRNFRLRNPVPRLPLGHPGSLQPRHGVLRPPRRRHGPPRADLCRRGWRGDADLVRRGQRILPPFCQRAEGGRPGSRRSRRGVSVAVAGIADRASGGISLRHGVDPAVRPVRRGCAGISHFEFRRQSHRHGCCRLPEAGKKSATACRT